MLNHTMSMQVGENPQHYLDRVKTSFQDELKAIPKIIDSIDAQIAAEKTKLTVNRAKIEELEILKKQYDSRQTVVKEGLTRTLPYDDIKAYISHKGDYEKQT
ncbi:hypothetical protein, partial [Leptospira idonii]